MQRGASYGGCSGNPEHLVRVLPGGGTEKSKASDVRPGEGIAQRGLAVQEMRSSTLAPGDCRSSQIPTLSRAPTGGRVCADRGRKGRQADSGVGGLHSPWCCQPRRGRLRRGEGAASSPPSCRQHCPGRPAGPRSARSSPSCSICPRATHALRD